MRTLGLWGPVVVWCASIYAFSATPDLSSGLALDLPLRKAAHLLEYAVLYLLTRRAVGGTWAPALPRAWLAAGGFSILYAMGDEYHQTFVRTRVGCWSDVGIDSCGVLLAWLLDRSMKRS